MKNYFGIDEMMNAEEKRLAWYREEGIRLAKIGADKEAFLEAMEKAGSPKLTMKEATEACRNGKVITSAHLAGAYTIDFDGEKFNLYYEGELESSTDRSSIWYLDGIDNLESEGFYAI